MIICPQQKLAMLLPWKTASQTLRARLKAINQSPYPEFYYFNRHLKRVVHQHITLADYNALPESQRNYALAVFIRNPYDRVFSGFRQAIRDVSSQPMRNFRSAWVRELVTEQLADNYRLLSKAQFNIDNWFQLMPAHLILETGRNSSMHLHPVHYWTHQHNMQMASYIGRVENFESDFDAMCKQFSIEDTNRENANRSEGENQSSDQYGYLYANRLNIKTIAKINDLFQADFELFDYPKIPA